MESSVSKVPAIGNFDVSTRVAGENDYNCNSVFFFRNFNPNDLLIQMTIIGHVRCYQSNTQTTTINLGQVFSQIQYVPPGFDFLVDQSIQFSPCTLSFSRVIQV